MFSFGVDSVTGTSDIYSSVADPTYGTTNDTSVSSISVGSLRSDFPYITLDVLIEKFDLDVNIVVKMAVLNAENLIQISRPGHAEHVEKVRRLLDKSRKYNFT